MSVVTVQIELKGDPTPDHVRRGLAGYKPGDVVYVAFEDESTLIGTLVAKPTARKK